MLDLGWHVIHGENLIAMLRRVEAGESPDMVYAEEYVNADRGAVGDERTELLRSGWMHVGENWYHLDYYDGERPLPLEYALSAARCLHVGEDETGFCSDCHMTVRR